MMELSDSLLEKLNDPEIIKEMTKEILLTWGKHDFSFQPDMGWFYSDVIYNFVDLPDSKIGLYGRFDFMRSKEMSNFLIAKNIENFKEGLYLESTFGENQRVLYAFNELFNKTPKDLSSIHVVWNKGTPEDIDFYPMFDANYSEDSRTNGIKTFEKGEWQEYLAKCYLASIKWGDNKKNILE